MREVGAVLTDLGQITRLRAQHIVLILTELQMAAKAVATAEEITGSRQFMKKLTKTRYPTVSIQSHNLVVHRLHNILLVYRRLQPLWRL